MASYSAPLTETVILVEGSLVQKRTQAILAETVTISKTLVAKLGAAVSCSDALGLSEAGSGTPRVHVALPEAPTWVESLRGGRPYHSTPAATVTVSEAAGSTARYLVVPRETAYLAEGLSGGTAHAFLVALLERVDHGITLATKWAAVQPIATDVVTLSENLSLRSALHSALAETVANDESLNGGRRFLAPLAETVTISKAIFSLYRAVQEVDEEPGYSEGLSSGRHLTAALGETLTVSESLFSFRAARVALNLAPTFTEALVFHSKYRSPLAETVGTAEVVGTKQALKNSTLAETVTLAESAKASRHMVESLVHAAVTLDYSVGPHLNLVDVPLKESYTLVEKRRTLAVMRARLGETLTVVDAVGRKYAVRIQFPQTLSLVEQVRNNTTTAVHLAETMAVAEAAAARGRAHVGSSETVTLSEARASKAIMRVTFDEALVIRESKVDRRGGVSIHLVDSVSLSESLAAAKRILQAASDTVTLAEGFQVVRHAFFHSGEGYLIFERTGGRQRARSALSETSIGVIDGLVADRHDYIRFAESVGLSEALVAS